MGRDRGTLPAVYPGSPGPAESDPLKFSWQNTSFETVRDKGRDIGRALVQLISAAPQVLFGRSRNRRPRHATPRASRHATRPAENRKADSGRSTIRHRVRLRWGMGAVSARLCAAAVLLSYGRASPRTFVCGGVLGALYRGGDGGRAGADGDLAVRLVDVLVRHGCHRVLVITPRSRVDDAAPPCTTAACAREALESAGLGEMALDHRRFRLVVSGDVGAVLQRHVFRFFFSTGVASVPSESPMSRFAVYIKLPAPPLAADARRAPLDEGASSWASYDAAWVEDCHGSGHFARFLEELEARGGAAPSPPLVDAFCTTDARWEESAELRLWRIRQNVVFLKHLRRIPFAYDPAIQPAEAAGARYAAVIVQRRREASFPQVVRNVVGMLGREWALHVFCGAETVPFVRRTLSAMAPRVRVHVLGGAPGEAIAGYNAVMLSRDFWQALEAHERVLVFQGDSVLLRSDIHRFLHYTYIGAPWCRGNRDALAFLRERRIAAMVGNGGLSLRDPAAMLRCLDHFITDGMRHLNEALLFAWCLEAMPTPAALATEAQAAAFALEDVCEGAGGLLEAILPLGLHAAWYYLDEAAYLDLLGRAGQQLAVA